MSACSHCGTIYNPGAQFCQTCGFPIAAVRPIVPIISAPPGTQRALVGTTPVWQIIFGVIAMIMGIYALSITSFFAPVAAIFILIGLIFLILGLLGKPIFTQQVVYQQAATSTSNTQSQRDMDWPFQNAQTKKCWKCGATIPAAAENCYECGAAQ